MIVRTINPLLTHGIKHPSHQREIDLAYQFALIAHEGQVRKYTGDPYIVHPVSVARIVAQVTNDYECICAGLLHDVQEDCGISNLLIEQTFGKPIARMVDQLTDISTPQDGARTLRKARDREHTAKAWNKTKTVKLADLIDNTASITAHDPDFARIYMNEKRLLLQVLRDGDPYLYAMATDIVNDYYRVNPMEPSRLP